MSKIFIIGEAGVNHNGDINLAYQLIDIAVQAGVDAIKFQTWKTELLLTRQVKKADYQIDSTGSDESQFDMIKKLELPFSDFLKLKQYCDLKGIIFLSSSSDFESVDYLINIGLEILKLSSADLTNYPYLKYIAKYNKEVILSTGMANMQEVQAAIDVLCDNGTDICKITVLHCNTEYPTPMADVNLMAMIKMREVLGISKIGYSDHTMGIEIPIAAVAIGAEVIEKHFTISRDLVGPDHKASLEPKELTLMVKAIRNVEEAISGNGNKIATPSEIKNIPVARKSIVAKRNIKIGEVFSEENITVKRPGTGISPMEWQNVLNKKSQFDFQKDELIRLSNN